MRQPCVKTIGGTRTWTRTKEHRDKRRGRIYQKRNDMKPHFDNAYSNIPKSRFRIKCATFLDNLFRRTQIYFCAGKKIIRNAKGLQIRESRNQTLARAEPKYITLVYAPGLPVGAHVMQRVGRLYVFLDGPQRHPDCDKNSDTPVEECSSSRAFGWRMATTPFSAMKSLATK